MKYTLVSIEAWRNSEGGWDWNNQYKLEEVEIDSNISSRKLCKWLRNNFYLNERSKGKVRVNNEYEIIEILNKATNEPIFAFIMNEG